MTPLRTIFQAVVYASEPMPAVDRDTRCAAAFAMLREVVTETTAAKGD